MDRKQRNACMKSQLFGNAVMKEIVEPVMPFRVEHDHVGCAALEITLELAHDVAAENMRGAVVHMLQILLDE